LSRTTPAELLTMLLSTVFEPGDPVSIVALLKHPLLLLGMERSAARVAAETVELFALRGGTGRPDIAALAALFERRLPEERRSDFWRKRMTPRRIEDARTMLTRLAEAVAPLVALRTRSDLAVAGLARATVLAF